MACLFTTDSFSYFTFWLEQLRMSVRTVSGQRQTERHPDCGVPENSSLREVTVVGRVISDTFTDRVVFAKQFLCCSATFVEQWTPLTL